MILIVGLGNPGKEFQKTRHNLGFWVIDDFKEKNNFPDFVFDEKLNSLISKGKLKNRQIILAKPQTFMNKSGQAVKSLLHVFKIIPSKNLIVIHDDVDLPLGQIKIVQNRGPAGHKGVISIIKELNTQNFVRFRIGIQPKTGKPKKMESFVIQKFTKEEEKIIKRTLTIARKGLEIILNEGIERAMQEINKKNPLS